MQNLAQAVMSLFILLLSVSVFAEPGREIPSPPMHSSAGLMIPEGFTATVFHEGVGKARHIAVRDNGDVFVALGSKKRGGGSVALRDTDGDGEADRTEYFGGVAGTGIAISGDWLYRSSNTAVYRYAFGDELVPAEEPELIVDKFPRQNNHAAKSLALDALGNLYVNSGAPSNACQREIRRTESRGRKPCPELKRTGGIWRFSADRPGQLQVEDGERYVTGIRNAVAITVGPDNSLYFVQHGRDQLDTLWPRKFNMTQRVELPAEEFHRAKAGADFGWPYTYYDPMRGQRMIGPEYGGDGKTAAEKDQYQEPLIAFPAHWAPNGIVFYTGTQFPDRYHGGAFIAFRGSWNRAPAPQDGYKVVFVVFDNGATQGEWMTFADGFKGREVLESPRDAKYRPTGLALGPDGALYIAETEAGRVWKIVYTE